MQSAYGDSDDNDDDGMIMTMKRTRIDAPSLISQGSCETQPPSPQDSCTIVCTKCLNSSALINKLALPGFGLDTRSPLALGCFRG